jgi:hypothetical protein
MFIIREMEDFDGANDFAVFKQFICGDGCCNNEEFIAVFPTKEQAESYIDSWREED